MTSAYGWQVDPIWGWRRIAVLAPKSSSRAVHPAKLNRIALSRVLVDRAWPLKCTRPVQPALFEEVYQDVIVCV